MDAFFESSLEQPKCPKCGNSSQNTGSPEHLRCASCKTVWSPNQVNMEKLAEKIAKDNVILTIPELAETSHNVLDVMFGDAGDDRVFKLSNYKSLDEVLKDQNFNLSCGVQWQEDGFVADLWTHSDEESIAIGKGNTWQEAMNNLEAILFPKKLNDEVPC